MFERFTDQSRQAVVLAQEEARQLNHYHIGTEHVLAGLIREERGAAARALDASGVTLDAVRERIVALAGPGQEARPTHRAPSIADRRGDARREEAAVSERTRSSTRIGGASAWIVQAARRRRPESMVTHSSSVR